MTERELNEKKKKYLKSYRFICNRIKSLERQIEELRESKSQAKTQEITDMPHGSGKMSDLSDYIDKLERLEEKASYKCEEKRQKKIEIENTIMDISDDIESDVLYKRYIMLEGWNDIAEELGYCERQIYRIHGQALHSMKLVEQQESTENTDNMSVNVSECQPTMC